MAQLHSKKQLFIQAPPEVIWKIHTDITSWRQWQPDIVAAELAGPMVVGATFQWKSGGLRIDSTVQSLQLNESIAWTGKAIGTRASHSWTLKPENGGTLITTEESMDGWLVGLLKLFTPKFLDKSLDTWLWSLKTRAEKERNNLP